MDASRQPRVFQACHACRSRKLKCVMDTVDGQCSPPCKRCRRESKQCTVPEPKRKRYLLESAATWTPAKRQQAIQSIVSASRPDSPVQSSSISSAHRQSLPEATTQSTALRPSKRQRTAVEPRICDSEDSEEAFIVSTAAPWALDFLPVTFCGTIADLSSAYGYQGPNTPSQTTSPPSTADGDERQEPERAISPVADCASLPQTVSLADIHASNTPSAFPDGVTARSRPGTLVDRKPNPPDSNYSQDLGLDDIFNYIRFG